MGSIPIGSILGGHKAFDGLEGSFATANNIIKFQRAAVAV
jgi:hypothetical protein